MRPHHNLIRGILIPLLFITILMPLSADEPRFVIETGPGGAVAFMAADNRSGYTFTGGEDGTLRVWNTEEGRIAYALRLSRYPLRMAAVHPEKPEIAVVTSDSLNSFILTVWDWRKGEKKGSYKLPESPLFLKYSPSGSFLVYGITNWQSLTFLDTANGAVLPYLTDGFGIVSNAFISGSEKTILTYSPSGSLQYWDIQEGTLKKRVATLANLAHIQFTPSGRYMVASNGQELLLVDLVSGAPREQIRLPSVHHMGLTPSGDRVITYSEQNSGFRLSEYEIDGASLSRLQSYANLDIRRIDTLLPLKEEILMTLPTGEMKRFSLVTERLETFTTSNLRRIEDMAATSEVLLLGTAKELLSLDTGFFAGDQPIETGSFRLTQEILPFAGTPGISVYGDDAFLLYTKEGASGSLALFSPDFGTLNLYSEYPYAFTDVAIQGTRVASLDRKGDVRITDMETGEISFNFSSFGIQTLAFTDEKTLIAGRGQSSSISTPLLHLNTVTGETVPIADSNLLTFQLSYDPLTRKLYSLGIEERRERLRTVLKSHGGRGFEQTETLSTVLGENLDARMLVEREGSRIFTSLGSRGINMLYWGGFTPFEEGLSLPGKIISLENFLVALNKNGSLGFWNNQTGELAFTLFLFQDDNWIALFPGGRFESSPGGERYLTIYDGASTAHLDKRAFRFFP